VFSLLFGIGDRPEHHCSGAESRPIVTLTTVTAATMEIKIDVVATGIVTVTMAALRSSVEPLRTPVSARASNRAAKIAEGTRAMGTSAIVPTRKQRRTIVRASATAKCSDATSERHTSTAMATVTQATSLHPGETEIPNKNTMRAIKLIKHADRKVSDTRSRIKATTRRDRSSQGVRSWVLEFKKTRRSESLIAFDSLFKDALVPSGHIKKPHFTET
jgi:hypothetical protein